MAILFYFLKLEEEKKKKSVSQHPSQRICQGNKASLMSNFYRRHTDVSVYVALRNYLERSRTRAYSSPIHQPIMQNYLFDNAYNESFP